ncbi:MAG: hypothetical protein PHE17_04145 [Thiothrix sp.]|uniref:hypothetical protein n=1 Tax=Thiothrix sp. TaxID=1032 RepID=UPI00263A3AF7|nr:hypothetical protein [Thiothrix sp.]MDD5392189.1 hypothetical protein [Thiothrix sp.]
MTRMFLLICLLCNGAVEAAYVCRPASPRTPPPVVGESYTVARKALIADDWEPVRKSFGELPERESCDMRLNVSCDFVFEDVQSGYALIVEASGKADMSGLVVTGYTFRCRP